MKNLFSVLAEKVKNEKEIPICTRRYDTHWVGSVADPQP
jgi:hypothetical protein